MSLSKLLAKEENMVANSGIVSFDLWMTLLKSGGHSFKTARNLLLRDTMASSMEAGEFDAMVRAVDRQADRIAEQRGTDVQFEERVNMVAKAAKRPALDAASLEAFYTTQSSMFAASPPVLLDPNTPAILDGLSVGRDLAVISNTGFIKGREMRRALDQLGILGSFKYLIFSNEVGYAKPSPRIFRALLDEVGVEPQSVTHVGDNPVADIAGAGAIGMRTVHMAPGATLSEIIEEI